MLARRGEVVQLDDHLERLGASVEELYGERPPPRLRDRVTAAAKPAALLRMRALAVPGPDGIDVSVETTPLAAEPAPEPVALAPALVPGGLGPHKWLDRRLLAQLEQRLGAVPLLVDVDGHVLEAAYANVFLAEGETLVTPPLDRRLLPGTVRASLIAAGREHGFEVREESISLERAGAADELLLSSAVRGLYPGLLEGDTPRFRLGARVRAVLRERQGAVSPPG